MLMMSSVVEFSSSPPPRVTSCSSIVALDRLLLSTARDLCTACSQQLMHQLLAAECLLINLVELCWRLSSSSQSVETRPSPDSKSSLKNCLEDWRSVCLSVCLSVLLAS
jgi:hypothetical protein